MKTVSEQMELARKAQAIVNDYTQEQIDEICLAIGWEVYEDENIAKLAKMAVEETGYGNVQSKIIKHKRKVGGVLHDIKGAKSVTVVPLLDKPARRVKPITADLAGFEVPDEFVVGYGLDYAQQYRNMPYIGVLKPEVYSK